jgi:hypothetical protein
MNKIDKKSFIQKFISIWGDTAFDLSAVKYQDYDTPVVIKCAIHNNTIERTPRKCLERRSYPCKICSMEKRPGPTRRKTTEEFIQQAQSIHGNLYDYSKLIIREIIIRLSSFARNMARLLKKRGFIL